MLRLIKTGSKARTFSDSGFLRQKFGVKNNINEVNWKSVDIFDKLETKVLKNDIYTTRKDVKSVDPASVDLKNVDQASFGDYSMAGNNGVSENLTEIQNEVKDVTDETIASKFVVNVVSEVYDPEVVKDLAKRHQVQSIFDKLAVAKLVRLVHSSTPFGDQFLKLLSGLTLKSSFDRHFKLVKDPKTGEHTILQLILKRNSILTQNGIESPRVNKSFSVDLSNHMKNPEFQLITDAFAVAIFLQSGTGFKFEELNSGDSLDKNDLYLDKWSTFKNKLMPPDAESEEFEFDAEKLLLFEEKDSILHNSKSVFSRSQYTEILRHFRIKPTDFRSPPGKKFLQFLRFLATEKIDSSLKIMHMDQTKEENRSGLNPFVKQISIELGTGEKTIEFTLDLEGNNGNHFESWTDCFVESVVNEYYEHDSFTPSIADLLNSKNGSDFSWRVSEHEFKISARNFKPWCETPSKSLLDNTSFLQITTNYTDKTEELKFPALDRPPHPLFTDLIRYLNDNRSQFLFLFKPNYFHHNQANSFTAGSEDLEVIFNQNKLTIILNHQRFIMARKPGENVTERTEKLAYFLMDYLVIKNKKKLSSITEVDIEDNVWRINKYCDIKRLLQDYSKTLKFPFTNRTTKYMLGKIYSDPNLERAFNKWYHKKFDQAFDVVIDPDKVTLESCLKKSRYFAKMITNIEMPEEPVDMEVYNRQRMLDVIDKFETSFDELLSKDLEAKEAIQILKEEVKSIRTISEIVLDIENKALAANEQLRVESEKLSSEQSLDMIDTSTEVLTEVEVTELSEVPQQKAQKLSKSQKRNAAKNKRKKNKQKTIPVHQHHQPQKQNMVDETTTSAVKTEIKHKYTPEEHSKRKKLIEEKKLLKKEKLREKPIEKTKNNQEDDQQWK